MFKTAEQTKEFFRAFLPMVASSHHCEIVVCPSYLSLAAALGAAAGSRVGIGAQNVHWKEEGGFTGEVSAPMLKGAGIEWVVIGHSERRQYFGETDKTVLGRTKAALAAGLRPIVCVGERLEERESNRTQAVLETQFRDGLSELTGDEFARLAIAYEPVWAIGTGKTATPEMAADAHRILRSLVAGSHGNVSQTVRILYGGSVKPDNIKALMAQPDIDGALVGGASLEAGSFASIINF